MGNDISGDMQGDHTAYDIWHEAIGQQEISPLESRGLTSTVCGNFKHFKI